MLFYVILLRSFQGFFQRSGSRRSWPLCPDPERCSVIKVFKNMCITCRFQKCLSIGMSKKGMRLNNMQKNA